MRSELYPRGLEVVTVALDTGGADAVRRYIEAANPEHPSLIDQAHLLDELLGIVNVPSGVWIDEEGMIVRPPETAFPKRPPFIGHTPPEDAPPYRRRVVELASKIRVEPEKYVAALRDWVDKGSDSPYALPPEEVIARSHPRSEDAARAAAHFELGQHFYREGFAEDAVVHFREAHRLQPENWTYKRQAWTLADRWQQPTGDYETDWVSDVERIGPENYYAPLQM